MVGSQTPQPPLLDPRSEDMEEVIGTPPSWMARYGTSILLFSVLLLAAIATFYRYPSVVPAELTLTTIDPPRPLRAPQDFQIKLVNTRHKATVKATEALVVAISEANFADVWDLSESIRKMPSIAEEDLAHFIIDEGANLGEIEQAAIRFQEKQIEYRNLVERSLDGLTTRALEAMIREQERIVGRAQRQQGPLEDDDVRTRASLTQAEEDYRQGRLSAEALNEVRRRRNFARDQLKANRTTVREANFEIGLLQAQIEANRSGLSGGTKEQVGKELRTAFESLKATIDAWNRNFTLVSPIDGTVLLDQSIKPGAVVLRGDDIAMVIPANPGALIGKMQVPARQSASLEVGQRVIVEFAGYPALEFGAVEGVVSEVEDRITQNAFEVTVSFPEGLITTIGKPLTAKPLMQGDANIITDDKPLLWRFVDRE
ncbi:MAG: HlyD family efflux transporter periplasmic adaptor subunit [Bacteroidota bacterium]